MFCMSRHGGASVSEYLHDQLHNLLETVDRVSITEVYRWLKSHGGYFKRFRGGVLQEWIDNPQTDSPLDLGARSTLAFLKVYSPVKSAMQP
jgi:protein phosphatase PTC6